MIGIEKIARMRRTMDVLNINLAELEAAPLFGKGDKAEAAVKTARDLMAQQTNALEVLGGELSRQAERLAKLEAGKS